MASLQPFCVPHPTVAMASVYLHAVKCPTAVVVISSRLHDDVPPFSDDILEATACQTEDTVAPQSKQLQDGTTVI
ncbi:hypothetical protein M9458_029259, partial [Cirrhinus mrigala]